jgi:hypothetical protein
MMIDSSRISECFLTFINVSNPLEKAAIITEKLPTFFENFARLSKVGSLSRCLGGFMDDPRLLMHERGNLSQTPLFITFPSYK